MGEGIVFLSAPWGRVAVRPGVCRPDQRPKIALDTRRNVLSLQDGRVEIRFASRDDFDLVCDLLRPYVTPMPGGGR